MAKKQVVITLTHPRPCRFNGKDLEIKSELMPPSLKAISECVRNFVGQLVDASDLEVASEPRIKLALDSDHYRGCVIIEIDESDRCSELEIQKFFTYLFDEGQAGIFERATESSEVQPETEHIIREEAERAKVALGGTVLMEEVSVFVGENQICTVAGKIRRPPSKLPVINPVPQVRRGSVSGFCRDERMIYFIEKDARRRSEFHYDPSHLHEVVSSIASNVFNHVEIVTQEFSAGNGKIAVTLTSLTEIEKDPSSLF
jgi:hypothetical protein